MAVARGQDALDGVHLSFDVDSTLADSCQLSRELGFAGKTLLHARQVPMCLDIFSMDQG